MNPLGIVLLFAVVGLPSLGAPTLPGGPPRSQTSSNKKLEQEILKAENRLGRAIAKRDVAALDKLLTDYFADSYSGSERATSKKTALDRCRNGTLEFYRINDERKITLRVDIVTVEGIAHAQSQSKGESESDAEMRVKRLWTRKNGRWQLVAQTREQVDDASEE